MCPQSGEVCAHPSMSQDSLRSKQVDGPSPRAGKDMINKAETCSVAGVPCGVPWAPTLLRM